MCVPYVYLICTVSMYACMNVRTVCMHPAPCFLHNKHRRHYCVVFILTFFICVLHSFTSYSELASDHTYGMLSTSQTPQHLSLFSGGGSTCRLFNWLPRSTMFTQPRSGQLHPLSIYSPGPPALWAFAWRPPLAPFAHRTLSMHMEHGLETLGTIYWFIP